MGRALVIVNPRSRSGGGDLAPALERLHAAGLDLMVESPERDALARQIAARCDAIDRVVVAGGDGTLNAAAPALLACPRPLGILPVGTANDLARTLGIPRDLEAAAEVITSGIPHAIDLGCVNGVLFFNAAHVGLGAELTRRLTPVAKRRWGTLAYPRALLSAWRDRRPFPARIICDNERLRLHSLQITVGNGRFYGGGTPVAEAARIDEGELILYSIPPQPPWQLVALLPRLRRGTHGDHPRVLLLHGRDIRIETSRPMPITTDGEIRTHTPAHFTVLPRALHVFVPHAYHHRPGEALHAAH